MKYGYNDIKIKPYNIQIRDELVSHYNCDISEAVDLFAYEANMTPASVSNYLSRKTSYFPTKFKIVLAKTLKKSYDEIIKTERQQVIEYSKNTLANISEYTESDLNILRKIKRLCFSYKLYVEVAKMYKCIASIYFKSNQINKAIENVHSALELYEDLDLCDEFYITCSTDLGLYYYYECDWNNAIKYYEIAEKLINEHENISNKIISLNYYRLGICYIDKNLSQTARDYFNKSLKSADYEDLADIYLNIGVTYKKENKLETAMDFYNKAFEHYPNEDRINKATVLNNKAELFKVKGNYETALKYIQMALNNVRDISLTKEMIFFFTMCEIKIKLDDAKVINELIEYLYKIRVTFVYKPIIISALNAIIEAYKSKPGYLIKLSKALYAMLNNLKNENTEFIQMLKILYCDIIFFIEAHH